MNNPACDPLSNDVFGSLPMCWAVCPAALDKPSHTVSLLPDLSRMAL